ncbi:23S rRNA (pseudouridine(1915)-N(3))-methyltransferase RlmH [Sandaracinobacter neustonicus]|uniref:Ribosomal RNA large subunit methyltransferase H n=1 Tax=Sandaracinobacter neustonicus TaxID=1715348 RepID=A0A501XWX7_9SPHN|nr:23S rRNA (pseudouridine(1915)-N(3))-methyltransferase RlmH [Sandaracinobacter neustonicus]TPE64604.1 23S rRNA (pseudouridine(1915)-N(3))-methyltransferase RlmH [Sandaracinobacter neustonicus]
MKFSILAYGKAGRGAESELVDRYLKRIPWGASVIELAESATFPPAPANSRTVVLDERGKALSSEAFAQRLGQWRDGGVRDVRFLLGPADGHKAETRDTADLVLALGPATWPHLLARAMLAEQLYRAFSILTGHPYHRE